MDALFFFLCAVTGIMAVSIALLLLYFAVKYRRRGEDDHTPRVLGNKRLEWFWTISPMFVFLIMFLWGASIYTSVAQPPPDAPEVFVIGKQWMWKIQHPGGQREINELHIPVGRPVKLTLTSEDVIHDFFVPAFRTKIDVIPGRYVHTWFHPTKTGRFHLFCSQYCGTSHANMVGSVVVMERAEYAEWLDSHAEGSLALQGRKLFLKLQCITCHSANSQARAPVLEDLYGRTVNLRDG
ncbi:MAG: cytochrome c oxidase subunit II, partial [Bacteroidales bacterium]